VLGFPPGDTNTYTELTINTCSNITANDRFNQITFISHSRNSVAQSFVNNSLNTHKGISYLKIYAGVPQRERASCF
jgi:hypothetical protein